MEMGTTLFIVNWVLITFYLDETFYLFNVYDVMALELLDTFDNCMLPFALLEFSKKLWAHTKIKMILAQTIIIFISC